MQLSISTDRSVLVIEARQGSGRWKPIACLAEGPFTRARIMARLRQLRAQYPQISRTYFRRRIRIRQYVPVEVAGNLAKILGEDE